ncbi:MAG: ATPase, partial [Staphylothermus sp.]|nr:ATPase [Staphylothermus sp.]
IRSAKNTFFIETETSILEKLLSNPSVYTVLDENISYLKEFNPLIIESFNDAAAPTYGSLMVNTVFIVSPGKVLIYSGDRYRKAVEVYSYKGDPWSITTSNILDLLGSPMKAYDIPLKIQSDKYIDVFDNIVAFISHINQ